MASIGFEVKNYQVKIGYELSGGGGGPKSRGYVACFGDDGYRLYQEAMQAVEPDYRRSVFDSVSGPLRDLMMAEVVEGRVREMIQTLLDELDQVNEL